MDERTRIRNEEQLRLLAIFHYVLAGLLAFFALGSLMQIGMGIAFEQGELDGFFGDMPPPDFFGGAMIAMGFVYLIAGGVLAVLTFLAARRLNQRRGRKFCFLVAGLYSVFFFPFGTLVGVFTFIVLNRDGVRRLFEEP